MPQCEYEFTGKAGKWKGIVICTLTGTPCKIEDYRARGDCDRLAYARQYVAKHGQEGQS